MSTPTGKTSAVAGLRNRVFDSGVTFDGDPLGTDLEETSGYPIENLATVTPDTWRSLDAAVDNTRFDVVLPKTRDHGLYLLRQHNLSDEALVRVTADPEFRWRYCVKGTTLTSTADITLPDEYTMEFSFRCYDWRTLSSKTFFYVGTGPSGSNADWILYVSSGGPTLKLVSYRKTATPSATLSSGTLVADGKWRRVAVTCDGANIKMYLAEAGADLAQVGSDVAEIRTPGTTLQQVVMPAVTDGTFDFAGPMRYWDRALSLAELNAIKAKETEVSNPDLIGYWALDEGTGTTAADDAGSSHDMTVGNSWGTFPNPHAAYSSGILPAWGQYRRGAYISFDGTNDYARTGTNLSNAVSMSFGLWVRLPGALPDQSHILASFGTALGATTTYSFYLRRTGGGALDVVVARYGAAAGQTGVLSAAPGPASGWHRVLIVLDGVNDLAQAYLDGTQVVTDLSIAVFTAATSQRFSIGSDPEGGLRADCNIAGPVSVWNRAITVAEDEAAKYGTAPEADPSIYLYYDFEDEGATIDNRGTAGANGDLTLTAGEWKTDGDTPEPTAALSGDVPGSHGKIFAAGWEAAAVESDGALFEIWDPLNSDGYVECAGVEIYETYAYETPSATIEVVSPGYSRSLPGYPIRGPEALRDVLVISVPKTDSKGLRLWREAVRRALNYNWPVAIVVTWDGGSAVLNWAYVLGNGLVARGMPRPASMGLGIELPGYPYSVDLITETVR